MCALRHNARLKGARAGANEATNMTDSLMGLIADAAAESQPRFACEDGDHFWHSEGGRCCPMGAEGCSQAAYVCKVCNEGPICAMISTAARWPACPARTAA